MADINASWLHGQAAAPLNYTIFSTDVANFASPFRGDDDRRVVRRVLYGIVRRVFEESGVPWSACHHEDRGDGTLTIVPPTFSTVPLVDPLLALLTARLRQYNRHAGRAVRLQLRAALHVGPVAFDADGAYGHVLNQTARLLAAPVVKQALEATVADLAFIVSAHVYEMIVRHTTGLVDPATFRRVPVRVKESCTTGWLHTSRRWDAAPVLHPNHVRPQPEAGRRTLPGHHQSKHKR